MKINDKTVKYKLFRRNPADDISTHNIVYIWITDDGYLYRQLHWTSRRMKSRNKTPMAVSDSTNGFLTAEDWLNFYLREGFNLKK